MHSAVSLLMVAGVATTLSSVVDLNPTLANNTCYGYGYGYGYSSDGTYQYGYGQCPTPPTTAASSGGGGTVATTTTTTASTTTTTVAPTTTTAAAPTTTTAPPKPKPAPPKQITTVTKVTKGKVSIKFSCGKVACKGTVKIWYHNVLLSSDGYKLAAGKTETIKLKLDSKGSKFVSKAKHETLTVNVSIIVSGGKTVHEKLKLVG